MYLLFIVLYIDWFPKRDRRVTTNFLQRDQRVATAPVGKQCIATVACYNNARLTFSAEEEDKLIELIQKNSVIYDFAHPKYKNTIYKDEIWIDIANTIEKSGKYKIKYC